MIPTITFHGAAGCVTGFCAEIRTERSRVLVDCGMFQGSKTLKALNYQPFPFDASEIDAVLLTHAHIDHSGLLPKLMRAGFTGPIYATAATKALCEVMLEDAGGIQEGEVRELNRRNQRRGRPLVEPIYTARDAKRLMPQFQTVKFGEAATIAPDLTAIWWPAGHILGAASIALDIEGEEGLLKTLFSGDLGPGGTEFVTEPESPSGLDHLIIESTYGDRDRMVVDPAARRRALAAEMRDAHAAGGPLLMPAFAVERSQELLSDILAVMESGEAPAGDVFLDSPLAIRATEVFLDRGWNKSSGRNPFEALHQAGRLRFLGKPAESDGLERLKGWHVIMAASGMCDAGRIRKHLKRLLWRREATVLLTGFQAVGTLGRLLAEGAERVSIQGDEVRVRARIRMLDTYSGHADAGGLVRWAQAREPVAGTVFIAHGEPNAAQGLSARLTAAGFAPDRLAIPRLDETFKLRRAGAETQPAGPARIDPAATARLDWHNDRARLLLALNAALDSAADDAAREALLQRLLEDLKKSAPVDRDQSAPAGAQAS
ncbi:metallo-beta-lactamase family protein [Caulobacter ginsengisoli]|uniref:Metallo-beta-lactamase family protein n=1 Tax=Caulobacter ginsengisoli TaxID=400775 RepID=A0ABU0IVC6_9CAUL|nr:MBL fold metallo-hydrolase [Caulobacter ginsengisoli]MDQ0465972.1 metallo-beta-lactamase family protein [Caulobacter ginsengisoli]